MSKGKNSKGKNGKKQKSEGVIITVFILGMIGSVIAGYVVGIMWLTLVISFSVAGIKLEKRNK